MSQLVLIVNSGSLLSYNFWLTQSAIFTATESENFLPNSSSLLFRFHFPLPTGRYWRLSRRKSCSSVKSWGKYKLLRGSNFCFGNRPALLGQRKQRIHNGWKLVVRRMENGKKREHMRNSGGRRVIKDEACREKQLVVAGEKEKNVERRKEW